MHPTLAAPRDGRETATVQASRQIVIDAEPLRDYYSPEASAALKAAEAGDGEGIGPENVYEYDSRQEALAFSLEASMEVFNSTIEMEDYLMGETTQKAAENGTPLTVDRGP